MSRLRALIVDDEPLARRRLHLILTQLGDGTEIAGEADGCVHALEAIARLNPDVLLLDIRMRDGSGFDVLDRLPDDRDPEVIFVTAFDDCAVRAFDVSAVDYLLKPVDSARLGAALGRARRRRESRDAGERIAELRQVVANLRAAAHEPEACRYEREFWIRGTGATMSRLDVDAINWITIEEDYVRLHTKTRSYLMRASLHGMRTRLDPSEFVQIHRTTIIRKSLIVRVERNNGSAMTILLADGDSFVAGRVYARTLGQILSGSEL